MDTVEYFSLFENDSPQWASSREIQKPGVNTALVINMSARKYSDIFPFEKIFCANRTARWLTTRSWLISILDGVHLW
jgi:hypothetical protein